MKDIVNLKEETDSFFHKDFCLQEDTISKPQVREDIFPICDNKDHLI